MSLLLAIGVFVVAVVAGRAVWPPVADILDVAAAGFLAVVLVSAVLRQRLEGVAVVVSHSFVYAVLVFSSRAVYAVVVGLLSTAVNGSRPSAAGWWQRPPPSPYSRCGRGCSAGGPRNAR